MPLQFLIVNMSGDGFVHGVLRILVPEDVIRGDNEVKEDDLMYMLGSSNSGPNRLTNPVAIGNLVAWRKEV